MDHVPFFKPGNSAQLAVWRSGQGITRATFINHVNNLSKLLPHNKYVINECKDRYSFLVAYMATLLRGQINLFPSSHSPLVYQQIRDEYDSLYCIADNDVQLYGFDIFNLDIAQFRESGRQQETKDNIYLPKNQLVGIAFTSGSTGTPKAFEKYWGKHVCEARAAGASLNLLAKTGACVVATVPAQHMYGFITSIMMCAQYGLIMNANRPFYPEDIRKTLEESLHPVILVTTPIQLRNCVAESEELPGLDSILSSAAPLDPQLAKQAESQYGVEVHEFYGATETGAIAHRRTCDTDIWTCFSTVQIAVSADGMIVTGDQIPQTRLINDQVELIDNTRFRLVGRNSDMIKIGGNRASLSELNLRLLEIAGVKDGVIFIPERIRNGEGRLSALVVLKNLTKIELVTELRKRIDPVFIPRKIKVVDQLPRNENGKLPLEKLVGCFEEVKG